MADIAIVFMDEFGETKLVRVPHNATSIIVHLERVQDIKYCQVRSKAPYDEMLSMEDYTK